MPVKGRKRDYHCGDFVTVKEDSGKIVHAVIVWYTDRNLRVTVRKYKPTTKTFGPPVKVTWNTIMSKEDRPLP